MNAARDSVALYDPAHPSNTWRLASAAEYTFPNGVVLGAESAAIVTGIEPVAFRAAAGLDPAVPVYDPWSGTRERVANTATNGVLVGHEPLPGETAPTQFYRWK